jgi:hypothetical protein
MAIKWGSWVRTYQDGTTAPLACIRVAHYLTRDEMAGALIVALAPEYLEDITKDLPKKKTEKVIREQLESNASAGNYWKSEYIGTGTELGYVEVLEWALRQVDRMIVIER